MNAPTCAFRRRANRCLREAQFAELGKFHYLWADQIFSYGDNGAGQMTSTALLYVGFRYYCSGGSRDKLNAMGFGTHPNVLHRNIGGALRHDDGISTDQYALNAALAPSIRQKPA